MSNKLEFELLIPDGSYSVVYHSHYFKNTFGNPRLMIYFQLAELSDYKHCIFTKWFNVLHFNQLSKGKFKFKVSKKSDFPKFRKSVFPNEKIKRFDRFALSKLKGIVLQAEIKAPERDYKQKLIVEDFRISKIVRLKPVF